MSVISQWTQADPDAASKWAANFTGDSRKQALDAVVQNWARNDPQNSALWLAALPDDAAKQSAMQNYVSNTQWQYPDLAAQFATALTDEHQRDSAIQNVARNWLRTDPTAATTWLNNTSLPQNQKDQLLNSVKK
jgi:putative heme degradation protein